MNHDILIFAEQRDGIVQSISYELIRGAHRLAGATGGKVIAVLPGYELSEAAGTLTDAGADEVLLIDHPILGEYLAAPYTHALTEAILTSDPEIVLFGSTTIGMELAPRTAARVHAGLVTDCTGLAIDPESGRLLMTRPNLDGISIDTFICEGQRPQMATVRPGVLGTGIRTDESADADGPTAGAPPAADSAPPAADTSGQIHRLSVEIPPEAGSVRILSTVQGRQKTSDITQARVLVAGGRGIGGPEGFEPLRTIAGLLNGEIACSRACVEAGWIDTSPQVGQTGKTVRPDLYLACGISGAFQHVTGMEGSKLIISINKNPSAPIFDISDLGIVGNVEVILPKLIESLNSLTKNILNATLKP